MKIYLVGTSLELAEASLTIYQSFTVIGVDAIRSSEEQPGMFTLAMEVENR